jgi:hypothetical protein
LGLVGSFGFYGLETLSASGYGLHSCNVGVNAIRGLISAIKPIIKKSLRIPLRIPINKNIPAGS